MSLVLDVRPSSSCSRAEVDVEPATLQCSVDGQLRGDYVPASPALVADALDLGVGVGVFASIAGDCLLQPAVRSRLTADVDHGSVADPGFRS